MKKGPQEPYHYTNAMHEPADEKGLKKPKESNPQRQNTVKYDNAKVQEAKKGGQVRDKKVLEVEEVPPKDYGKHSASSKGPVETKAKVSPASKLAQVKRNHDDKKAAAKKQPSGETKTDSKKKVNSKGENNAKEESARKTAKEKSTAATKEDSSRKAEKGAASAKKQQSKTEQKSKGKAADKKATPPTAKTPRTKNEGTNGGEKKKKTDDAEKKTPEAVAALLRADTEDIAAKNAEIERKENARKVYKARKARFYRSLESPGLSDCFLYVTHE